MRRVWFVVIVAGIAAVIVVIGNLSLSEFPSPAMVDEIVKQADDPIKAHYKTFLLVKGNWQTNPVAHYRLHVAHDQRGETGYCERDVEVENERVQHIFMETCDPQVGVHTVTELFTELEQRIPKEIQWVSGRGCDLWVSHSQFNLKWNFPHLIDVQIDPMSQHNVGAYKYRMVRNTGGNEIACSLMLIVHPPIEVLSFSVLP